MVFVARIERLDAMTLIVALLLSLSVMEIAELSATDALPALMDPRTISLVLTTARSTLLVVRAVRVILDSEIT